jgi:hypothetical protein
MKIFDDDWWVDDAEKRVRKLNKRLNYGNRLSDKNKKALMRMLFKAIRIMEEAIWLRNKNYKERV